MKNSMEKYKKLLTELNAGIWDYAELKFNEHQSAVLIEQVLEEQGFMLEKGIAGMETAFTATAGSGRPVIGLLAEFDALSGLSQES